MKTQSIKLVLLFVLFLSTYQEVYSNKFTPPEEEYLAFCQVMPAPKGGYAEIYKKITYPEKAVQIGVEGKVFVLAYVDETGKVVDCSILRGIGHGCDEAALNAVKSTEFTPGMHDNKNVKVKVSLTIQFKLQ